MSSKKLTSRALTRIMQRTDAADQGVQIFLDGQEFRLPVLAFHMVQSELNLANAMANQMTQAELDAEKELLESQPGTKQRIDAEGKQLGLYENLYLQAFDESKNTLSVVIFALRIMLDVSDKKKPFRIWKDLKADAELRDSIIDLASKDTEFILAVSKFVQETLGAMAKNLTEAKTAKEKKK